MGWKRAKTITKKLWRFTKWVVGWPIAFVGVGGIPDSVETWSKWIDKGLHWISAAMSDPRVQYLAERAVEIANFVNQPPVRVGLVIIGVSTIMVVAAFLELEASYCLFLEARFGTSGLDHTR